MNVWITFVLFKQRKTSARDCYIHCIRMSFIQTRNVQNYRFIQTKRSSFIRTMESVQRKYSPEQEYFYPDNGKRPKEMLSRTKICSCPGKENVGRMMHVVWRKEKSNFCPDNEDSVNSLTNQWRGYRTHRMIPKAYSSS
jgi:hypothetical protein